MTIQQLWLNLPVKDIEKSKEFFLEIGFKLNQEHGNSPVSACFLVGEKHIPVMLFEESVFEGFSKTKISDTKLGSEILISFDADSRLVVDELVGKVKAAGGIIFGQPEEVQNWMYGFGFCDLDGHRWNVLYMDKSKM